ncbi:DUF4347 domain-containing protein [Paramagnetospirillum kuznetsovii]|nr:DUF4347 domain-containing protein [Paramagnetospirillum kuznetsovii]
MMFDGAADITASEALQPADATPVPTEIAAPAPHEIAFIDANIADFQALTDGLRCNVEVHILDPGQDGLSQRTSALAGRDGFDAIHIISHAAEGQVQLGEGVLSLSNLDAGGGELSALGRSLMDQGGSLLCVSQHYGQSLCGCPRIVEITL